MDIPTHAQQHDRLGIPASAVGLAKVAHPQNTVVIAGDSILALGDATSGTPYTNIWRNSSSPVHRANFTLGCPFTVITNLAVPGRNTTDVLNNFSAVLATGAGWLIESAGTNDISASNGTLAGVNAAVATALANKKSYWAMAQAAGMRIVVGSCVPRGNFSGTAGEVLQKQQGLVKLNHKVEEYCAITPGMIFSNWYPVMVDTSTLAHLRNGDIDGTKYTADAFPNVHLNTWGGKVIGDILAADISSFVPRVRSRVFSLWDGSAGDVSNLVKNGMAAGTGGTVVAPSTTAAGVADSWHVANTGGTIAAVCTKTTRPDGLPGPAQQLVITGGAADTEIIRIDQTAPEAINTHGIAPGDAVFCEAQIDISEAVAGNSLATYLDVICYNSVPVNLLEVKSNFPSSYSNTADLTNANGVIVNGVIRTPVFTVPAIVNGYGTDCTQALPMLYFQVKAGSVVTAIVWGWQMRKVQT